jgi:hypothetical protein
MAESRVESGESRARIPGSFVLVERLKVEFWL